ncbi:MAG TPA: ABC transporter permease subunit [Pseudonocardiaceae bacterium]
MATDQRASVATRPDEFAPTPDNEQTWSTTGEQSWTSSLPMIIAWRVLLVGGFLALWEWLPKVPNIAKHVVFLDPFFISSPSLIAKRLWQVVTGADGTPLIWPPFLFTVVTALIGTAIAIIIGTLGGLLLSNSATLERVLRPIIVALNAVPRIAMVPIVVLLAGSSSRSDIITAVTVVVFLVFYNALEGGRSVPPEMIDNAKVMGAGSWSIMRRVRLPLVLAWVSASIPNAIAFGLVGSVTTEIFSGAQGIGQLLGAAVDTADATLTFTVVVVLTIVGVTLVVGSNILQRRLLPWWNAHL